MWQRRRAGLRSSASTTTSMPTTSTSSTSRTRARRSRSREYDLDRARDRRGDRHRRRPRPTAMPSSTTTWSSRRSTASQRSCSSPTGTPGYIKLDVSDPQKPTYHRLKLRLRGRRPDHEPPGHQHAVVATGGQRASGRVQPTTTSSCWRRMRTSATHRFLGKINPGAAGAAEFTVAGRTVDPNGNTYGPQITPQRSMGWGHPLRRQRVLPWRTSRTATGGRQGSPSSSSFGCNFPAQDRERRRQGLHRCDHLLAVRVAARSPCNTLIQHGVPGTTPATPSRSSCRAKPEFRINGLSTTPQTFLARRSRTRRRRPTYRSSRASPSTSAPRSTAGATRTCTATRGDDPKPIDHFAIDEAKDEQFATGSATQASTSSPPTRPRNLAYSSYYRGWHPRVVVRRSGPR